jgi:hypothetical protein
MHDAATVCSSECVSDLNRNRECLRRSSGCPPTSWRTLRPSTYCIAINWISPTLCRPKIVQMFGWSNDDASLASRSKRARLEALSSEFGREDFDHRRTIERRIDDLINSALATFTDFFDDTIMEEELPDHRKWGSNRLSVRGVFCHRFSRINMDTCPSV